MAAPLGGSVHAAHIFPSAPRLAPDEDISARAVASIPARERLYTRSLLQRLRKQCARHGVAERNVDVVCGDPGDELPRIARSRRSNLVVMGAVEHSGILGFLLGSMPEIMLGRIPCDLLIVHPL